MEDLKTLARMARNVSDAALKTAQSADMSADWSNHARALKVAEALETMARDARDTRPVSVREFDRDAARAEARAAEADNADRWVTGAGGSEEPGIHNGHWSLYQWNPARAAHRWLDLETMSADWS